MSPLGSFSVSELGTVSAEALELFTSNCVDEQDGPRDRMSPIYFGLFLVLLNTHRIKIQSSI